MSWASRDQNYVPVIIGVSSLDGDTPTRIAVNPNTGAVLIDGPSLYATLDKRYIKLDATNTPVAIQFDTTITPLPNAEGLLQWNATDGTLDLGMDGGNITQQIGQEMFMKVRNVSGSTITNGSPVYILGRTGNRPNIYLAKSNLESTSAVIGLTTQDISSPDDGFVTTFGYVRQIKTDYSGAGAWGTTWVEGDNLYVSKTVAGQLTNVEPTAPHHSDIVGTVAIVGGAGIGSILVRNQKHVTLEELTDVDGTPLATTGQFPVWNQTAGYFDFDKNINDYTPLTVHTDMKDPTGFVSPDTITVSYSSTDRTITLTGTLDYYWRGVKKTLTSPWTSTAHSSSANSYYLYSTDGTNFTWSVDPWTFDNIMVAKSVYKTDKFALREVHGLMPWQVHEELHEQISAYRESGGSLTAGTYLENSDTDANVTPSFDAALVQDEDLHTTIPAWTQGTYTTMRIGASSTSVFDTTSSFPYRYTTSGYINYNNATTGVEVEGATGKYYNVYQILVPTTSDTDSQKYRMIMLQPQKQHPSLIDAQAEDVRSLALGDLLTSAPEFVFYARITYLTNASYNSTGKVVIATGGVTYLTGSKLAQVSVSGFTPSNHNDLTGLQGGTADEYYHLTAAQNTVVGNTSGTNTGDKPYPTVETNTSPIVSIGTQTNNSTFIALINGTPTNVANSVVTFDTVTAGDVAVITPATTCLAKMKMYNVTRGNYALIIAASGATFTVDRNVTTLASPWQDNDQIQITSSVMGGLGSLSWVDYEITSVLTGKSGAFIKAQLTGTSGNVLRIHPYTSSTSTSKYDTVGAVTGVTVNNFGLISLISDSFCLSWVGAISSSTVRESGYII